MNQAEIEDLVEQALELLQAREPVRALAIADQLAAHAPEYPVVRMIRAQALMDSGDDREAFAEARRGVELAGRNQHAHRLLAWAAWRMEKLALAQQSFEQAVALSEWQPSVMAEYAWFMASARGPKLAERAARAAVRADATSATAWAALGRAQHRLHRLADAEASIKRALQLDPNNLYAQAAMVEILQAKRKDAQAVALAHVMRDTAGTEEFVQAVQKQARMRELNSRLLEREEVCQALVTPSQTSGWRRLVLPLSVVVILVALAAAIGIGSGSVPAALAPLLLLLLWRVWCLFE